MFITNKRKQDTDTQIETILHDIYISVANTIIANQITGRLDAYSRFSCSSDSPTARDRTRGSAIGFSDQCLCQLRPFLDKAYHINISPKNQGIDHKEDQQTDAHLQGAVRGNRITCTQ